MENVQSVNFADKIKKVITEKNKYEAKSIIIANGVKRRKLGCKGESEFLGTGVSYCATCDGAFFKNKDVAVVGAGNTALEDVLFLSNICKSVTMIIRSDKVRGNNVLFDTIKKRPNVCIIYNTIVTEIVGSNRAVTQINTYNKVSEESLKLNINGVFIAIGLEPDNSMFSKYVNLDENGYIISDESCLTNIPGVFVAGDTRTKRLRQIITASSDGAIAANNASTYLNENFNI